jgi:excisionase family DNA binding protein
VSTQLRGLVARPLLVHHVAKRLGLSCRMVRYLARRGKLRAFKIGPKIWQFLVADVDQFRARREARHA